MIVPTTPANEADRLASLRALRILDTPPDQRFDRIVRLASSVFDVPIAYVAFIDAERQWFKSSVGLCRPETSRWASLCGHTILQDQPLIIPDTTQDDRVRDNPMVTGPPFIRFYAGHPLKGPGGYNVATLCLSDTRPRDFTDAQVNILRDLAGLVEHELRMVDVIGAQRELIDTQHRLMETQRRLDAELAEAAAYVESLLPRRYDCQDCQIRTDYRFISSSRLGGDLFGYHWLNDSQLALYLLDVTGHGIAASLLSAQVGSALGRDGMLDADRADPGSVLTALNRSFPMEQNHNKFFTIWYGVYDQHSRTLQYASGGHPPAVTFNGSASQPACLGEPSFMIGIEPDTTYETRAHDLAPGDRLYVFSDGAFEVRSADGRMLSLDGFVDVLARASQHGPGRIDAVLHDIRQWQARDHFDDDLSLLEVEFM